MSKEKYSISKGMNNFINAYYKTCFNSRKTNFYVRGRAYLGLSSHKRDSLKGTCKLIYAVWRLSTKDLEE